MENSERTELLKLYELIIESEDRFHNRAETRSRFYQVISSTLFGASLIALVRLADSSSLSVSETIVTGFVVQITSFFASLIAIWALPGIYRVYRRSVWEAYKRYKLEILMGLAPGKSNIKPWPDGLSKLKLHNHYLVDNVNFDRNSALSKTLSQKEIKKRTMKGVFGWNSLIFYTLSFLGILVSGACTVIEPVLLFSFFMEIMVLAFASFHVKKSIKSLK